MLVLLLIIIALSLIYNLLFLCRLAQIRDIRRVIKATMRTRKIATYRLSNERKMKAAYRIVIMSCSNEGTDSVRNIARVSHQTSSDCLAFCDWIVS